MKTLYLLRHAKSSWDDPSLPDRDRPLDTRGEHDAATKAALIAVIEALDDTLDRVMLIGHNPGLAELAHHFDSSITVMPTCALAEFRFDVASWACLGQAGPVHTAIDSPKNGRGHVVHGKEV